MITVFDKLKKGKYNNVKRMDLQNTERNNKKMSELCYLLCKVNMVSPVLGYGFERCIYGIICHLIIAQFDFNLSIFENVHTTIFVLFFLLPKTCNIKNVTKNNTDFFRYISSCLIYQQCDQFPITPQCSASN